MAGRRLTALLLVAVSAAFLAGASGVRPSNSAQFDLLRLAPASLADLARSDRQRMAFIASHGRQVRRPAEGVTVATRAIHHQPRALTRISREEGGDRSRGVDHEGAVRRVRGRRGLRLLLRRRGRALRRVRPPRAPRQQARRQAPPLLAAQPVAVRVAVADAAAALRHLPGEEGVLVLQGGPGDPVPGVRHVGAHGERAQHAPRPLPAHRRAGILRAGRLPRAPVGGGEHEQPLLQRRRRRGRHEPRRQQRQQHLRVPHQDIARVARGGLSGRRRHRGGQCRRRRFCRRIVSGSSSELCAARSRLPSGVWVDEAGALGAADVRGAGRRQEIPDFGCRSALVKTVNKVSPSRPCYALDRT